MAAFQSNRDPNSISIQAELGYIEPIIESETIQPEQLQHPTPVQASDGTLAYTEVSTQGKGNMNGIYIYLHS